MAIVVYFSRAEENLINGKLQKIKEGNTKILAGKIAQSLGCPIYSIEPVFSYPSDYKTAVEQAKKEKENFFYPKIKKLAFAFEEDQTIFLGFPNWWGTYPMPVARFLAETSLKGKVIYPFCTHEGSAFGTSIDDLHKACPDSLIKTGLPVRGSRVAKSDTAVQHWLDHYYGEHHRKE